MTESKERLQRENTHAKVILESQEKNWGWAGAAGQMRWQRRVDFLTKDAKSNPDRVLEIGCGTGTFSKALRSAFRNKFIAIDLSEDLLNAARKKYPEVEFCAMDAHHLDFETGSFDLILGCSVLHHLDWRLALTEFYNHLKMGGRIRFSEPNLMNPQIFLQKKIPFLKKLAGDSPDESAFTKKQIEGVLQDIGFKEIKVAPFEFLHPSTPLPLIPTVIRIEKVISRSFINQIAGSLSIEATK